MRPRVALALTAVAVLIGPFLFGVAVATTIGHDLIASEAETPMVLLAALLSAIGWNLFTWFLGLPSSSTHALIGGILGAVGTAFGPSDILLPGLLKVIAALFIAPALGLIVGFAFMQLVLFLTQGVSPRINSFFKSAQAVTCLTLALGQGTNDAQKAMALIAAAMVSTGHLSRFDVPFGVMSISAAALALGMAVGGRRIIRTVGGGLYTVRPVHAFSAQAASAVVLVIAALLGGPVSTTHVVSSAIVGVGSAERMSKVRWAVAQEVVTAWLVTIPATAVVAAIVYLIGTQLA
jgi:PiT family inorganic phosphate transporter